MAGCGAQKGGNGSFKAEASGEASLAGLDQMGTEDPGGNEP
jgi:hypothetical protein